MFEVCLFNLLLFSCLHVNNYNGQCMLSIYSNYSPRHMIIILLWNLSHYSLHPVRLAWIKNLLASRNQTVKTNSVLSIHKYCSVRDKVIEKKAIL